MTPRTLVHDHTPLFRVVRRGFADPLDASFSRGARDNRWNDSEFPALYGGCSERVARAVTLDVLGFAGLLLDELQDGALPQLVEIDWQGELVDASSPEGVAALELPPTYPRATDKEHTRAIARELWQARHEGVLGRSPSLSRIGFDHWNGDHRGWGELALFVDHLTRPVRLVRRRTDLDWLSGVTTDHPPG